MSTSNKRAEVARQTYEVVDIDSLLPHPRNPHLGDDAMIGKAIDKNGFYGAISVQASTRYILAGHTRWRTLKRKGVKQIPVIFEHVDDDRALAILLNDNRTTEFGGYDEQMLADALAELAKLDMLIDAGYDEQYLADLNFQLAEAASNVEFEIYDDGGSVTSPTAPTSRTTRTLPLEYPTEDFDDIVKRLEAACDRHGARNISRLVIELLAIDEEEAEARAAVRLG